MTKAMGASGPLPGDAKQPTKMIEPGIDPKGDNVFFGFELPDGERVCLLVGQEALGQIINNLQVVAKEAQQRRLTAGGPLAEHLAVKEVPFNPVKQLDIDPDVSGQFSVWSCTNTDGTVSRIIVPFSIMEGIVAHLPSRIDEMKRRQASERH